jgi:hypothetical protein
MSSKAFLRILFGGIFLALLAFTGWASTQQPVFEWGGLVRGPDRYWTIATLMDAYFGFTTFYVWVFYKERGWLARGLWFVAIMALGNMAMASYVLLQLARLEAGQPASDILLARRSS